MATSKKKTLSSWSRICKSHAQRNSPTEPQLDERLEIAYYFEPVCVNAALHAQFLQQRLAKPSPPRRPFDRSAFSALSQTLISQRNGSNKDIAAKKKLSYSAWLVCVCVCVRAVCEVGACSLSALLLV